MKALLKIAVLSCFLSLYYGAYSQFNPAKMATDKINNRAVQKTDQAIDKGLDAMEDDIEGKNAQDKEENGEAEEQESDQQEGADEGQSKTSAQQEQTPLQSYSKFDFIPGEKVIFFDDFSQDNVGDFPALWNTNGSGEVVNTNLFPGNWLQFSGEHAIWTNDLLSLPDNYTIEFDVVPMKGEDERMKGWGFRLIQAVNANAFDWGAVPGEAGFFFYIEYFGRPSYRTYINSDEGANLGLTGHIDEEKYKQVAEKKYHISVWVQKARIRLYQNESKIIDLPRAFNVSSVKMDRIRFEDGAALVSNVRIAVGAPDTRNKLITEGKLVTYGIYFDVNKDVVKPESYGTLKDIAKVLTENPDVRVKIIGHTDADGVDASNLDLSKRRAASVKNELVKNFAIAESRIETDGMGESQPVAPNDTPSNKALNRRVEFIKL
jgi:outer membrane protein OmpA-like peptidoglycan-associated protein